ncbi:hypothetical protein EUBSIR_02363 [[Eubacterium] siraeum DSM 15702]|uniref:Uncharacterized protein n=1 Tax=[Eubacterium] siraeum DSM 15702 TaxID=428128 RepID=B0MR92_9FIRM|nr:hypothetical protein EUBSIR_02363 [[Eubacterium] siraeum DSM 15702]
MYLVHKKLLFSFANQFSLPYIVRYNNSQSLRQLCESIIACFIF